jgi:hypothetical protein
VTWPNQSDCDSFYGDPRGANNTYSASWAADNLVMVPCPWPLGLIMDDQGTEMSLPLITVHSKCADALTDVLNRIWEGCQQDQSQISTLRYDRFSGSFNFRPIRGGTHLSMHAYGCAFDWDAPDNQQGDSTHIFQDDSLIVVEFKRAGAVWGGDWSGSSIDAMHFQFAVVDTLNYTTCNCR